MKLGIIVKGFSQKKGNSNIKINININININITNAMLKSPTARVTDYSRMDRARL